MHMTKNFLFFSMATVMNIINLVLTLQFLRLATLLCKVHMKTTLNPETHPYVNTEMSVCTWWLRDHVLWECIVATNWLFVYKPCPNSSMLEYLREETQLVFSP